MDARGPMEARLLTVERFRESIGDELTDLKRQLIALQQGIWDAWSEVKPRVSNTCVASFTGTLHDCTGAGFVGQIVTITTAGGSTLGTFMTMTGGAFSGTVQITNGSQAVLVTTALTGYSPSSTPKTFACGANSIGTISPTPILNNAPTLNSLAGNSVNTCGTIAPTTVNLSGITDGDGGTQSLTVTATSSSTSFIPNPTVTYTSPNTTGTIVYTPSGFGSATISVAVTDSGSTSCGGVNKVVRTFTVANAAQCGPTTLDPISNVSVGHGLGLQSIGLTGIGFGPNGSGCNATAMTITAASSNPGLIANPSIVYTSPNATATLQFTPPPSSTGTATISVTVTSNLIVFGACRSNVFSHTFVITVT